jgi:predicted O-methyltransferase YrrM
LKLPSARHFKAFRSAPRGRRFQVVRKLWNDLARPWPGVSGECIDLGEFSSFEEFGIKYAALADFLGFVGKTPPPGELDFLHAMVELEDTRHPGGISAQDYFFLTALVSILAPRRAVEIGTLTGFSAAIIAAAIYRQHGSRDEILVETIDLSSQCIVEETRPTGFEIPRLIPDLASTVRVHTRRGSDFVRELGAREEFGVAFIDADHRHPWPLLDVIRLAPYVQSAGWIVLHDIQLGTYGKAIREADQSRKDETPYGAEWLFERWPFRKIRSAHIGAIELPARRADLIPFSLSLMEEPLEVTDKAAKRARRALYQSLVELV